MQFKTPTIILDAVSLPLMRKTFIEAAHTNSKERARWWCLFRLCGRLSLRRCSQRPSSRRALSLFRLCGRLSLRRGDQRYGYSGCRQSLPLMRKTFIEAPRLCRLAGREPGLFRLCGRLSLRRLAEKTHRPGNRCLFRLCGRLSLRRRQRPARRSGDVGVSSAYAEDFH